MESDLSLGSFHVVNRIKEVLDIFQSNGYRMIFETGFVVKPPTGITFRLRSCIKRGEFFGLPDFDSKHMFDDRMINDFERIAKNKFYALCSEKRKQLGFKAKKMTNLNIGFEVMKTIPDDLYFDINMYVLEGKVKWSPYNEISNSCGYCLKYLSTPVYVDGARYFLSRPYNNMNKDNCLLGYDSYQFVNGEMIHLVDWACNHGEIVKFKDIKGYDEGFRHIAQLYGHNHNHYMKHMVIEDRYALNKGVTTPMGQYITTCLIENIRKLSEKVASFRALTGVYPLGRCYKQLINPVDKIHYKANALITMFGFYKIGNPTEEFIISQIDELSALVSFISEEVWERVFDGKSFYASKECIDYIMLKYPKFAKDVPCIDVSKLDVDDDIVNWLNNI